MPDVRGCEALGDTTMIPTEPGLYWFRFLRMEGAAWTVVELTNDGLFELLGTELGLSHRDLRGGEFGPKLVPPTSDDRE